MMGHTDLLNKYQRAINMPGMVLDTKEVISSKPIVLAHMEVLT